MIPPSLKLRRAGKSQIQNKSQIPNPKLSYFLLVFLSVFLLLVPLPAQQAFVDCPKIQANCPKDSYGNPTACCTLDNLLEVPVHIFNFLLGMAAAVLLVVIVWAGLRMILYHASEMPEAELTNAKMTLQRGIFGFIIIAFSYLLVSLVLSLLGFYSNTALGNLLSCFFKTIQGNCPLY